ncbi:RNA-directed DNA polymerase, eukaryota [Tanacetum coccineum]
MGNFRTKEDDLSKISTSIYVTNFPDTFTAKELFQTCKQYGHVVDAFIPNKRSKEGKKFGFVRFINVFNTERLVSNLCTIWVNRSKIQANIARFCRSPLNNNNVKSKYNEARKSGGDYDMRTKGLSNSSSFASVVAKKQNASAVEVENVPTIVLEDDCLKTNDLSCSLMGRVKEFAALTNLKSALRNEDFNPVGRLAWVEVEGVPYKLWTVKTFNKIAAKWGDLLAMDDMGESCYHSRRVCVRTNIQLNIFECFKIVYKGKVYWLRAKEVLGWEPELVEDSDGEDEEEEEHSDKASLDGELKEQDDENDAGHSNLEAVPETIFNNLSDSKTNVSEDPFGVYKLLQKNGKDRKETDQNVNQSLQFPPGFTPVDKEQSSRINGEEVVIEKHNEGVQNEDQEGVQENFQQADTIEESVSNGRFKDTKNHRSGGSFMCLMEEVVKVGSTMGYNMEGVINNMSQIIETQGESMVNFMSIQETKMEIMELISVRNCWGNYAFNYVHSNAVGNSGGILCVWDSNSFVKESHTILDFFVIIRGKWLKSGIDLIIVAVYGPHDPRDKRMVWEYLSYVINQWNGNVVVMGDFNEVRYKLDRFGSVFNVQGAEEFNAFIADVGLEEVPLGGSSFTWCHKSATKMKLDGFSNFVSDVWKSAPGVKDNGIKNMAGKLKYLKGKIREWIKSSKEKGNSDSVRFKEDLRVLDEKIDKKDGSNELVQRRTDLIKDINHLDQIRSMDLAQKSKMAIRGVMVDGEWIDDPMNVKRGFQSFFGLDLVKTCGLHRISIENAITLSCYHMSNKLNWNEWDQRGVESSEKDVFEAVHHFFVYGDIPKGCNASFITLIPKISAANMVNDFRPISLIGSIYKIIAKILANRLVGVLDELVNEVQSAFIVNRQILDGPFILNEMLQWCKSKKKQSLIFKVDFEKAYDSVRWDFLDEVLSKFGFGSIWRKWIQVCLNSSRGSILINGSPTEEFQFYKGLKQGDPLSPFLFILAMESFHLSFQRVVDSGMFKGLYLNNSLCLSHMFYADDVIFVGNWSDENIKYLMLVLDVFKSASRLKINLNKSKIMGINVEGHKVKQAANKIGCLILSCPFSYLGSKVGVSMSRIQDWREVIDKMKHRLSKWKMKSLSIGGRLTLLKSVLGSIPIFNMSIFKVPLMVLKEMESIRGRFFNGHEFGSRKASWIKMGEGNGQTTRFWFDDSYQGGVLKDLCLRMYTLETCKDVSVYEKMQNTSVSDSFRREIRGGREEAQFNVLKGVAKSVKWRKIDDVRLSNVGLKTRWVKSVPIKVNVLSWKVMVEALPTRLNMSRRDWQDGVEVVINVRTSRYIRLLNYCLNIIAKLPSLPLKSPVYHEPSVASVVSASVVDRSIGIDNPHLSLGSQADLWCIEHLRYYFLGCLAEHPTFMGHSNLLIEVR